MFTINIYLRIALMAVTLIGGTILMSTMGIWYGFPFVLIGLALLFGYFWLGTIQSAAELMQKMDSAAVDKRLSMIMFPKLLYKPNRAYYYLIKGSVAMQLKNYDVAESFYTQAQEIGLPGDNEKAMVALQMANLKAAKGKWKEAQLIFKPVKGYKVSEPQLREQIKQFEKILQNSGQAKAHQGMGVSQKMRRYKRF